MARSVESGGTGEDGSASTLAGLLGVLSAANAGDFSARAQVAGSDEERELAVALNELIEAHGDLIPEPIRRG